MTARTKKTKGYIDFGFAKYDHNRQKRLGFPEAVYSPSKTKEQLLKLAQHFLKEKNLSSPVIFTRVEKPVAKSIQRLSPKNISYNETGRILALLPESPGLWPAGVLGVLRKGLPTNSKLKTQNSKLFPIAVITGGTGDIPVAEEAAFTCEVLGVSVRRLYDVGVAGIHRLISNDASLRGIACAIVCAGMEGALPSVVGGMVACPVIGVPTSVGYGISEGGHVALNTILSSCASNVCAVNIDNGFSAGVIAHLIVSELRVSTQFRNVMYSAK